MRPWTMLLVLLMGCGGATPEGGDILDGGDAPEDLAQTDRFTLPDWPVRLDAPGGDLGADGAPDAEREDQPDGIIQCPYPGCITPCHGLDGECPPGVQLRRVPDLHLSLRSPER